MAFIPYGRQDISPADIKAVTEALCSDYLTQGPAISAFEEAVSSYCGVNHAIAVNSATSALHIACMAVGLGKEDIAWTTPNSFVASANCILYCGAQVDFVDILADGINMCPDALAAKLKEAKAANKLPKVVIPVHMSGHSAQMDRIAELADEYGFHIIEDASHAIGSSFKGKKVGCCQYSDITVFSFHPVKIITSAEGGMATTNNPDLAEKMARLRSHGITRDTALMTEESHGAWYYQQLDLGLNYRMTDLHASLGLSQMTRLDEFVMLRHDLAKRYDELINHKAIIKPEQASDTYSSWHLYILQIDHDMIALDKKALFKYFHDASIGVNLHYIPIHLQPYYENLGFKKGDFPNAEQYYRKAISIPLFAQLTLSEQDKVIDVLMTAIEE